MTLVVVPPLTDSTTELEVTSGERLLDLNLRFAERASDPAGLWAAARTLGAAEAVDPGVAVGPGQQGSWCLLGLAAADALAEPGYSMTRLRAMGAAIRVLSVDDPGLTASIDDIALRSGSTQSSAEVVLAAARCTLFDPELALLPAREDVELVIDGDQQLPAAVRLLNRLTDRGSDRSDRSDRSATRRRVTLSGHFVRAHREALARLPELSWVGLSSRVRPRLVRAQWRAPDEPALVWVDTPDDLPAVGDWAGWLAVEEVLGLGAEQVGRCVGLVVSVTSSPTRGAGGPGGRQRAVDHLLRGLAARIPVAVEILVGASGAADASAEGARWSGSLVRIAGFRLHRPAAELDRRGPGWDLARWATPAPPEAGAEVSRLLAATSLRHDLFPGRVAGALFAADRYPDLVDGYRWDPAVRLVRPEPLRPDVDAPGPFLVSLRTGVVVRVSSSVADVVSRLSRGGAVAQQAMAGIPAGRREQLLSRLQAIGLVHRKVVAA